MSRSSFLAVGVVVGALSIVLACNGSVSSDACGADGGPDSAPSPVDAASSTDGSASIDSSTSTDGSTTTDAGTGACVVDQDCNESPASSALSGKCFFGNCMCNIGLYVQPNGKCGKAEPGPCMTAGGKCRQMPATCQPGELAGEMPTNMSCGDFIEAVCCFPGATCKAPSKAGADVDFRCCMPNDGIEDPICVNGWKVCPQGGEARTDTSGCGG